MSRTVVIYLTSHLFSLLGNGVAAVALPLIVLQATGSPLGSAALAAATAVPAVAVGLLGGMVIDRINRRTAGCGRPVPAHVGGSSHAGRS
ncbi:hypothetical protein ACU61A_33135 [Pseudonocardia sichuanensis]